MDVKRIRQQLADCGLPACFIDRLGIAGAKEQIIGLAAGLGVAAEKRPDTALEANWQRRHRRPATKPPEGRIDEQVFSAEAGDRVPLTVPVALYRGVRSLGREERAAPQKLLLLALALAFAKTEPTEVTYQIGSHESHLRLQPLAGPMTMIIGLTDDLQRLLRKKVENGQFPSEEAVVKEALRQFLIEKPFQGASRTSAATEILEERLPGPFTEDQTMLAPVELPRPGQEIACFFIRDASRQPDLFPGE